ncbi:DUF72 domain-containing protein [Flavisphingomonas formosensis]|uniref:DUF72 domain-containing protein n=1 Tax=Flavisphingomonas formosensis TaxID=861534 RepID=UPI0012F9C100|nr:DUF72 domain-containing protein [Sphingomonas formosensis]
MIRIGCSGWNYRHWRGRFYPEELPVKRWFEYYAFVFDAVELNNSFYRLPKPETFANWRDAAPKGFRFAVKAPRFITHMRKLKDAGESVARFLDHARNLGPALGPILYQLPPNWHFNAERLAAFLELLPPDLSHVFEFRDPSWMVEEACAMLDRHGASFCAHDFPGLETPRWAVGRVAYVRFHGGKGKYWGRYSAAKLRGWSDWMAGQEKIGREVWGFFNNDGDAHAIADARALLRLLRD